MIDAPVAVILAAGLGSRMRRNAGGVILSPAQDAAAAQGVKSMIPDARGRPFLDHMLSSLADGGVSQVCLVVGPGNESIGDHYAQRPPQRTTIAFVVQPAPLGTANAVLAAEPWTNGRDLIVLNADNLYPPVAIRSLVDLTGPGLIAFERTALLKAGNIGADRIAAFAILRLRDDDTLGGIIEKPDASLLKSPGVADWISMNLWRFDPRIFDACRTVELSSRKEFELPLAVASALGRGMQFRSIRLAAEVLDLSQRGDIAEVARRLGEREIQP